MPILGLPSLSILNKEDLRGLLQAIAKGFPSNVSEQAKQTGLSERRLRSVKHWATQIHLIDQDRLTQEGELMITKDPYLEAIVTDWLIHFSLSLGKHTWQKLPENLSEWNGWTYFIYSFLPEHPTFTLNELINGFAEVFPSEPLEDLTKGTQIILKTYIDPLAIAKSRFLIQTDEYFSIGDAELSNPYTTGYLLAKIWERDFGSQRAVLVDEILNAKPGLLQVLGIQKQQLRQQLDILAEQEIIEQRSAKPYLSGTQSPIKQDTELSYQIIRCWEEPLELLEKAYDNDAATPNQPLMQSLTDILDDSDTPDFSQFLDWVSQLHPRETYTILKATSFDSWQYLVS